MALLSRKILTKCIFRVTTLCQVTLLEQATACFVYFIIVKAMFKQHKTYRMGSSIRLRLQTGIRKDIYAKIRYLMKKIGSYSRSM